MIIQVAQLGTYQNYYQFGSSGNEESSIQLLETNPFVKVLFKKLEIQSQLIGKYNYHNISAAIAIGDYFEVSPDNIKSAIESEIVRQSKDVPKVQETRMFHTKDMRPGKYRYHLVLSCLL